MWPVVETLQKSVSFIHKYMYVMLGKISMQIEDKRCKEESNSDTYEKNQWTQNRSSRDTMFIPTFLKSKGKKIFKSA